MKRSEKFIILAALLVIVAAGYALTSYLTKEEETADEDTVTVAAVETTDVTGISWSYNSEDIALNKAGDSWVYSGDSSFPLDQSFVEAMLSAVSEVTASRSLTDAGQLSEYGLEQPFCVVTIETGANSESKFALGDQNQMTQEYYLQYNDQDTVYLVSDALASAYSHTLLDLVKKEDVPFMTDIDSITIIKGEDIGRIIYREKSDDITYTDVYRWFWDQGGGEQTLLPLDRKKMANIKDKIISLYWQKCVAYKATSEELAGYGLTETTLTLAVVFTDDSQTDENGEAVTENKTFTLQVGNKTDDSYYVRLEDSSMVYTLEATTIDPLMEANYDTLRAEDVCLMDWDTMDMLDVTIDGQTSLISFNREETKDDQGNTVDNITYLMNGATKTKETVVAFLNSITGLTAEEEKADGEREVDAEVTLVFHRNTSNFRTMTLTLSPYGSEDYLAGFNGEARLLVNKDSVDALKAAFNGIS